MKSLLLGLLLDCGLSGRRSYLPLWLTLPRLVGVHNLGETTPETFTKAGLIPTRFRVLYRSAIENINCPTGRGALVPQERAQDGSIAILWHGSLPR